MVIRVALWKNHLLPVTLGSQFGDYLLTFGIPPQSPTSTRRPTKSMTPVIWGRLATSAQCLLLANPSIVTRMVPAPSNADALVDWERGMRHTILWDSWQVLLFHPNFFLWGLKETLYDIYIFFFSVGFSIYNIYIYIYIYIYTLNLPKAKWRTFLFEPVPLHMCPMVSIQLGQLFNSEFCLRRDGQAIGISILGWCGNQFGQVAICPDWG